MTGIRSLLGRAGWALALASTATLALAAIAAAHYDVVFEAQLDRVHGLWLNVPQGWPWLWWVRARWQAGVGILPTLALLGVLRWRAVAFRRQKAMAQTDPGAVRPVASHAWPEALAFTMVAFGMAWPWWPLARERAVDLARWAYPFGAKPGTLYVDHLIILQQEAVGAAIRWNVAAGLPIAVVVALGYWQRGRIQAWLGALSLNGSGAAPLAQVGALAARERWIALASLGWFFLGVLPFTLATFAYGSAPASPPIDAGFWATGRVAWLASRDVHYARWGIVHAGASVTLAACTLALLTLLWSRALRARLLRSVPLAALGLLLAVASAALVVPVASHAAVMRTEATLPIARGHHWQRGSTCPADLLTVGPGPDELLRGPSIDVYEAVAVVDGSRIERAALPDLLVSKRELWQRYHLGELAPGAINVTFYRDQPTDSARGWLAALRAARFDDVRFVLSEYRSSDRPVLGPLCGSTITALRASLDCSPGDARLDTTRFAWVSELLRAARELRAEHLPVCLTALTEQLAP